MRNEHTGGQRSSYWLLLDYFVFWILSSLVSQRLEKFFDLVFLGPLTLGVLYIVYCFKYNKIYINDFVEQGYKVVMTKDEAAFMSTRIGIHLSVFDEKRMSPLRQPAKKNLNWPAVAIGGITLGVAFGVILHILNDDDSSTIASTFDSQNKANSTQPPDPINATALNLFKNIIIEDIVSTMLGNSSVFPEFTLKSIPLKVTSVELSREYESNELIADEKYKSKQVIVTGNVSGIHKDFADDVIIDLPSRNQFTPVGAELAKSARQYVWTDQHRKRCHISLYRKR